MAKAHLSSSPKQFYTSCDWTRHPTEACNSKLLTLAFHPHYRKRMQDILLKLTSQGKQIPWLIWFFRNDCQLFKLRKMELIHQWMGFSVGLQWRVWESSSAYQPFLHFKRPFGKSREINWFVCSSEELPLYISFMELPRTTGVIFRTKIWSYPVSGISI